VVLARADHPDLRAEIVGILRGVIDAGDGGTPEQRSMIETITHLVLQAPELDPCAIDPLPAAAIPSLSSGDPLLLRRIRMLVVLVEFCRHPLTEQQVSLADSYGLALGGDEVGLRLAREMVTQGAETAMADLNQSWLSAREHLTEVTLREKYSEINQVAPELAEELMRMHEQPRGTLGREYVEFYLRYQFKLPGQGAGTPSFFVAHDMCHLIAGYGPTAPEEVALAAFHLGMSDNDDHWVALITALAAYELGLAPIKNDAFEVKQAVLSRDGAAELMAKAYLRGRRCSGDTTVADHLALAPLPISEVRAMYGVPDPEVPFPTW
jgi:hypothetical protein